MLADANPILLPGILILGVGALVIGVKWDVVSARLFGDQPTSDPASSSRTRRGLRSTHHAAMRAALNYHARGEIEEAVISYLQYLGLKSGTVSYQQVHARLTAAANTDTDTFRALLHGLRPDQ